MKLELLAVATSLGHCVSAQNVPLDPGTYGPALELVHLYYDEFPTGRKFDTFFEGFC